MSKRAEPWYVHAVLYVIILALTYLLIHVAIIEPNRFIEEEKYYKTESRIRMENLREAQILWNKAKGQFTDNLDSLIYFIKTDTNVQKLRVGFDSLMMRPTDPFDDLVSTESFVADSLYRSPKTFQRYIVQVDTSVSMDTVIDRRGRIVKVDTNIVIGQLYLIQDPDGYGTIGDLFSEALKNTASWE
jgi:hypothetical protein